MDGVRYAADSTGEDWLRAWEVAEAAVYYEREAPVLEGAMFFHATYIKPDWARGKRPLARIAGTSFISSRTIRRSGRR